MSNLTPRQIALIDFMVAHFELVGFWPTLRQVGAALSMKSTNGVHEQMQLLISKGYVERSARGYRALRLATGERVFARLVAESWHGDPSSNSHETKES